MIRKLPAKNMWVSNLGWLKSRLHFSFAEYYNEKNVNFGALRVINDNIIAPKTGFPNHTHHNMEIITYVVDGKLTHKLKNDEASTLCRGEIQYMSAGNGVEHSEYNHDEKELRCLQIWIIPDKKDYSPKYGEYKFEWKDRTNNFLHLVSSEKGNAPVKINQDINFYVIELEQGKKIVFKLEDGRQAYIVQIEGVTLINTILHLHQKDGFKTIGENLSLEAIETSHLLVVEMQEDKSN